MLQPLPTKGLKVCHTWHGSDVTSAVPLQAVDEAALANVGQSDDTDADGSLHVLVAAVVAQQRHQRRRTNALRRVELRVGALLDRHLGVAQPRRLVLRRRLEGDRRKFPAQIFDPTVQIFFRYLEKKF